MEKAVIIGGGAAGLMAAITAKIHNMSREIIIVEKNLRPARKLMITGKGRCNVTNNCDIDTLISSIPRNPRFLYSAFSAFSSRDTMDFFEDCGVPLKTERGNRVFPVSDKAVDIVDALVKKALSLGVKIINGTVTKIFANDNAVSGVLLENGERIEAEGLIVATGGLSYPVTGSTGDGYLFAKELGHKLTDLTPSLVPMECHEGFCSILSGLSLKNVTLSLFEEGRQKPVFKEMGEMIFTHFGVSGPLVLSASAFIRDISKKSYSLSIDLKPALSEEQLDKRILRDFEELKNKDFANSLGSLLPKSLIPVVIKRLGIEPSVKINQISKEQRQGLVRLLKSFTLTVTSLRPIEEAIITRGGVSVKEINPQTMESKLVRGLFFAGEVIDVDAFTGGFNLQIAFSTGFLAGKSI